MYSVTQRISQIHQPYGGYLKIKDFNILNLNDNIELNPNENIHPSTMGLVIDYMSRFLSGANILDAFKISIKGAYLVNQIDIATELLNNITGLDDISIICASKLCGYDIAFRAGPATFKDVTHINPNNNTIKNIRTMVTRSLSFFENYGPVILDGFTFEGGYTNIISTGDGDFLTKDTLWDFKVSKNEPTSKYTLQILVYYIMGLHSIYKEFKNIKNIGLFNPRLNKIYLYSVDKIDKQIIETIEKEVIGY